MPVFEKILRINFLQIFLKGSFMGFADMIPGISGSTIAMILGIYDQFLSSIKNIKFTNLFKFKFKDFFLTKEIKFLSNLFLGIFFSFIFFSKILNFFLSNNISRSLLFSFFLGLVISSIFSLLREIKFNIKNLLFLISGAALSLILMFLNNNYLDLTSNFYLKLIISGNLAIFAMLLPGISGSYVLLILGIYPLAINAIANIFEFENITILFFLSLGIFLGFLVYPRLILFLLKKYYFLVLSFLIGLMLGSIYGLWPFWEYKEIQFNNKSFLICDKFTFPNIISIEFLFSLVFIMLGCFIFNKIKQKAYKKEEKLIK